MQTTPNSEAWLNVAIVGMSDDSQSIIAGILGHVHRRLTISGAVATYLQSANNYESLEIVQRIWIRTYPSRSIICVIWIALTRCCVTMSMAADKTGFFISIGGDLPESLAVRWLPIKTPIKNQLLFLNIVDTSIKVNQVQLFTSM